MLWQNKCNQQPAKNKQHILQTLYSRFAKVLQTAIHAISLLQIRSDALACAWVWACALDIGLSIATAPISGEPLDEEDAPELTLPLLFKNHEGVAFPDMSVSTGLCAKN